MKKTCFVLPLFLLPFALLFIGHAAAADTSAGTVQIENRSHADTVFSCDVKLSGGQIRGNVFAVVFAESGQMKSLSGYPAAETVQVTLQNVANTDCVKIVWADANQTPLASPAVLRMSGNGAAAYAQFSEELMKLQDEYGDIGGGAASGDDDPYILARLLVSCTELPDLSAYNVAATIKGPDNLYVLQFLSAGEAETCAEYLRTCPTVRYAEPDSVMQADGAELLDASAPPSWGAEATGITAYAENLRQRGMNGTIVVAVVDSGADMTHSLLKGRLVSGYDFVDNDNNPQDEHGHGTHVSGIIASCTPDMNVKIMPLRVLDAYGGGNASNIGLGIYHAAKNGANVINLSLGLARHSSYVEEAISYAISKNITVVVAAGNQNSDVKSHCPAHMAECVTVAAVDSNWKRFELSNYGDAVDIAAPGVAVNSSIPGGGYKEDSGTSMAAPHVSAAAALLMEERGTAQTPAQISGALRDSAASLDTSGANAAGEAVRLGAGFLNLTPFIIQPQRTIVFYANGGTGTMTPQSAASGSIVALKANTFARDGYQFTGWNTNADGSGTAYTDGATLTVSQNLSLYAQWEQESRLYALLYADGEMVFQNENRPNPEKTLVQAYAVDALSEYAKWYERRADIKTVTFAEPVRPLSTALWFYGCENLTEIRGFENLDVGAVTNMSSMFARCSSLETLDLRTWSAENVTNMRQMFSGCASLREIDTDYYTFDVSKVMDSKDMFTGCYALVGGYGTRYNNDHTDKAYARIDRGASAPGYFTDKNAPKPEPATDVYALLYSDGTLTFQHGDTPESGKSVTKTYKVDLDAVYSENGSYAPWYNERESVRVVKFADKISPKATAYWFFDCRNLQHVDNIRNLDTASVTNMRDMFGGCNGLTALDVSHFDTANVTDMASLFSGCSGLTALDVSHFDTANVTYMTSMFGGCNGLTALDVSHFDTANVTDMASLFSGCSGLTALDVSHFDTANVTYMSSMFDGCSGLKTIYASEKFTIASVIYGSFMFKDCWSLVGGAGTKYDSGYVDKAYARIDGGASAPGYFTRK